MTGVTRSTCGRAWHMGHPALISWRKLGFHIKPIGNMGWDSIIKAIANIFGVAQLTYKPVKVRPTINVRFNVNKPLHLWRIFKPNKWTIRTKWRGALVAFRLDTWDNLLEYHEGSWSSTTKSVGNWRITQHIIRSYKFPTTISTEFRCLRFLPPPNFQVEHRISYVVHICAKDACWYVAHIYSCSFSIWQWKLLGSIVFLWNCYFHLLANYNLTLIQKLFVLYCW